MTTHYEDHDARFTSVSYYTPGGMVGELALEPGQYAITIGEGENIAVVYGNTEDLARFVSRVDNVYGQIRTHEVTSAEPEPELPPQVQQIKDAGGDYWTTAEMQALFTVESFLAPYVQVIRKSDGQRGSLAFSHSPRFYYEWRADS